MFLGIRECLEDNPEKEYTIICCNLENFKLYNDLFGRRAGDRLLVEEAKTFQERVGMEAICCRYTADRLLCFRELRDEEKGHECHLQSTESGNASFLDNTTVKLGVYKIIDRSISVEQMCDRALLVVDSIKGIYDQHIVVYDDALRNKLLREQAITDAMETALKEEQFTVYFQPKYNLENDTMVGAEALVRWIHPEWGFMSPVSVNVSRADVFHRNLVKTFCELIEKYKIDPSYLHLEITESAYTESPEKILNTVEALRKHGFVIEMDDFGSGYSSLNMLSRMSIDILKLDMAFIRSELAKNFNKSILGDVIKMAHRMQLKVVAEGVETEEHKNILHDWGCDFAQGYFYSKPLPEDDFESLLTSQAE